MVEVRSACPLNCPDSCAFWVELTEQGLKVRGDKENRITRGFICAKGRALANQASSPERLHFPLLREGQGFKRIGWEEAYTRIAREIRQTLAEVGPWGILHHYDYGHNGVLRALDRRFFQALGGVTEPRGSMCWGAGYRAQELDFGGVYSSSWADLAHAQTIVLWGKDPVLTHPHLMPFLLEAKAKGTRLIAINPLKVKSAKFVDEYLQVRPGTDGALALGLAHVLLSEGWLDLPFVRERVLGLEDYAQRVKAYPPERTAEITGVAPKALRALARTLSHEKPVSILLGYGLQRYTNGGNTVRAIDALAAVSGNVGRSGAGVHYAHQYHKDHFNSLLLPMEGVHPRSFPHARIAENILRADPPVQLAVVTRSNPLVQQPDSYRWQKAWQSIRFKVVLDWVMTETARQADLILPIASVFEDEDIIATSWSPMIQYAQKVMDPPGEAKPEWEIFTECAKRLDLASHFPYSGREWLKYALEPLVAEGITLERLQEGPVWAPYIPEVAWADGKFLTPSGKIELSSALAAKELGDGVADYVPLQSESEPSQFSYLLLTPHLGKALHSQFQEDEGFKAFLHPQTAAKHYLWPGDRVLVETAWGELTAVVQVSEAIHPEAVVIPEGDTEQGLGVNRLIPGRLSDLGENTAYYDVRCSLRKPGMVGGK